MTIDRAQARTFGAPRPAREALAQPDGAPALDELRPAFEADRVGGPDRARAIVEALDADYGQAPWETPSRHGRGFPAADAPGAPPAPAAPPTPAASAAPATAAERAAQLGLSPDAQAAARRLDTASSIGPSGTKSSDVLKQVLDRVEAGDLPPALAAAVLDQLWAPDAHVLQAGENTCVAATAQKALIALDPKRYVDLVADLAKDGRATLPDGQPLSISAANRAAIAANGSQGEALVDALVQSALMDHGNGADPYDWASDTSARAAGSAYAGLNWAAAKKLNQDLLGAPTFDGLQALQGFAYGGTGGGSPQDAMTKAVGDQLRAAMAGGGPGVFVPMQSPDKRGGQHMVLVTRVGDESVTVTDALGREQDMPIADFARNIAYANATAAGGIGGGSGWGTGAGSTGVRKPR